MKTILSILILGATVLYTACNNSSDSKESSVKNNESTSQAQSTNATSEPKNTGTINDVVSDYLKIKNALTTDNGNGAASGAKDLGASLAKVDETSLNPEQKKTYDDLKDDIKEHAEHIGTNGSNIAHQREHFDLLSKDMIDLVKTTGSSTTLYRDFCPMYNNKKGASWLSETKEIKNPYYGNEMLKCGQVKEEIKPKG